jgi:hypothetical protein
MLPGPLESCILFLLQKKKKKKEEEDTGRLCTLVQ